MLRKRHVRFGGGRSKKYQLWQLVGPLPYITYIRLSKGWMYLVAVLDWYSRYVVSWEVDQTLQLPFFLETVVHAFQVATPDIWNSDQGYHFTSTSYITLLREHGVRISMDGRGRALDNIFTERLWRTLKYEEVYLKHYESPRQARASNSLRIFVFTMSGVSIKHSIIELRQSFTLPQQARSTHLKTHDFGVLTKGVTLVSPQRGWDYLQRLGQSSRVPRPQHAKADEATQQEFKKTSRARGPGAAPASPSQRRTLGHG